jgi:hypothetical protein
MGTNLMDVGKDEYFTSHISYSKFIKIAILI